MSTQPSPYTRRRFLRDMGMAGGAAAVLSSMEVLGLAAPAEASKLDYRAPSGSDFSLQGRGNGSSVVVIGAGVAGLTTAYELQKAGYRVTVLEGRDRPGGRNWTVRRGTTETDLDGTTQRARFDRDLYFNAGPARIPQHHTTMDYCRELGVPLEVFGNQNADAWYYNEASDSVSGALAGTRVRHRQAKADVFGQVSELLSKATNAGALDDELTAADREALVEFLRSFGALSADGTYTGSTRVYADDDTPRAGLDAGTPTTPAARSDILASRLGNYFAFEQGWDQAMLMFQPVGGMDRIAYALEKAYRGRVTYGAEVTKIRTTGEGVSVEYRSRGARPRAVTADWCVCTVPPQVLVGIDNDFGPEVNADLAVPSPASTGKIGLQYGRRWWEEDERIHGGITNTNMDVSTIWYPSNDYLSAKGVVVGYYNFGANADAYGALSPQARLARAIDQGEKVHGPVYRTVEQSFSVDWRRTRFSEGGWVSWPSGTRSVEDSPYRRLLEPAGRTYFAGDHLSWVIAWQHGAFESARKVVTDLHTRVLAS